MLDAETKRRIDACRGILMGRQVLDNYKPHIALLRPSPVVDPKYLYFFLTRIVLRNYKSIGACDVRLGPLTYMAGANGSGKSSCATPKNRRMATCSSRWVKTSWV